jgi:anti-sigma factor RsiW
MTAEHDPFVYDDAAYVLGALSEDERQAFEAHLATCADCQARVAEVRDLPALLAGISGADVAEEAPPETLLPGLLRRAGQRRHRQRWLVSGLGAVAAACLVALAVVLWPFGSSGSGTATAQARTFHPITQTFVKADAVLVSKPWGTQIDVHCSYAEGVNQAFPYSLRVYDEAGDADNLGSWLVPVGQDMRYQTGTRYSVSDIAKLQILKSDGTPVLELDN